MTSVNSISSFQRTGNPNTDAQTYATKNGISLEAAKAKLQAQFGAPTKPTSIFDNSSKKSTASDSSSKSDKSGEKILDALVSIKLNVQPKQGLAKENGVTSIEDLSKLKSDATTGKSLNISA
ncbi:MAG: hypothetical protein WCG23_06065 [bacterium]